MSDYFTRLHPRAAVCALVLGATVISTPSDARSLRECGRSVRVGSQLIMAGDDANRAHKIFSRNGQWTLVRSSSKQRLWRREGRSARTIRLKVKDGRLEQVCQID